MINDKAKKSLDVGITTADLPQSWRRVPIGEIAYVNPSRDVMSLEPQHPISFVPMAAVEAVTGRMNPVEARPWESVQKGYTPFREGDVLFAKITPCMENGKCAIAKGLTNGYGAGSTEFHVLRASLGVETNYLFHFLLQKFFRGEMRARMQGGAGQLRVPDAALREYEFPLPPLPEQRRIVARIEELLSQIDAGVDGLRALQKKLKRYRAAVLKAACEGTLVPTEAELARAENREYEPASELLARVLAERRVWWEADQLAKMRARGVEPKDDRWKARYKQPTARDTDALPVPPEGWQWTAVDCLAKLVTDGDHNPPKRVAAGVPHLTAKNIFGSHLDYSRCTFVTEEDAEKVFQRYKPQAGDLIVTCVGTIGRTAIVPVNALFSPDRNLAAIRPLLVGVATKYLQFFLMSTHVQRIMVGVSGSTAQPHLYLGDLRLLAILLPPLAEQERIVAEVERRLSVLDQMEVALRDNLKRADRLRQAVLRDAFAGKLVPQNPDDEPAAELLARIRAEREATAAAARASGPVRRPRTTKATVNAKEQNHAA